MYIYTHIYRKRQIDTHMHTGMHIHIGIHPCTKADNDMQKQSDPQWKETKEEK